tara:strand:+ start:2888 stop:3982 length:1095 start_codon:yes stop_codon:yes gene_type:complete
MALPKKLKTNINISPRPPQPQYDSGYNGLTTPNRRRELAELITEDGTFLPKSVLHADMDKGMLEFVKSDLDTTTSGKKIPVIDRILTLQRWGEFSQTWSFTTEDKNVSLPFIVVVRQPQVTYGTNPSLQYTIPDRKQFHFAKVPTWDGNRKGVDIYSIPQPIPVDITYDVKIICNRMRELNQFNKVVMQKFSSRQAYTFVKGHYIPIISESISDESVIDTEDRRYYQQSYTFQLQGFLIDEDEFEVKPAISRSLLFLDTNTTNKKIGKGSPSIVNQNQTNIYNKNKFRRIINFASNSTGDTITYAYKATVNLVRSDNVSSVSYQINGTNTQGKVEVSIGDVLKVIILKSASGTAQIVLEEIIYV